MTSDRELLFGVMAVQLGFCSAQAVMAAAALWAGKPGAPPIGQVLLEQKKLDASQRKLVDAMVARSIASAGDAQTTVNTLSGGGKRLFQSLVDSAVRGSVAVPDTMRSDPGTRTDSLERTGNVLVEVDNRYDFHTGPAGQPLELGRGGIGRVVVAVDRFLGRPVAFKEILTEHTSNPDHSDTQSLELEARFLREARLTGQLEHPAIVPVFELGRRAEGGLYYTMQRVRGGTLYGALTAAKTLEERLRLMPHFLAVCQAVAYAHSRGVVHRDVKPQNVMIGAFGETYLLDWGLARIKGRADPRAKDLKLAPDITGNALGGAIGTPAYMSPEQARGRIDEIDERSDVWCLGAVLFEVLTGRPPFTGTGPYDVLAKLLSDPVPAVRALSPGAPRELVAVAEKCLQRDRQARYPSAEQLARDVEAWLSGKRVSAHEYTSLDLAKRFYRKSRAVLAAAVVGLLLVVGAGALLVRQVRLERDEERRFAQLFLDEVAAKLAPLPKSKELLQRLSARALNVYQDSVDAQWGSREERRHLARSWVDLGDLNWKVDNSGPAMRAYGFASKVARALLAEQPSDVAPALIDAEAQVGLAWGEMEDRETQRALARAEAVLARLAALPPEAAPTAGRLNAESQVLRVLGELARRGAGSQSALVYAERALAVSRQLPRPAGDAEVISDLSTLGRGRLAQGDLKGAKRAFADAAALLDAQVGRDPRDHERLYTYGLLYSFIAAVERLEGDPQAELSSAKALDFAQRARALMPASSDGWSLVASIHLEAGQFTLFSKAVEQLPSFVETRSGAGYQVEAAALAGDVEAVQRALDRGVGAEDVTPLVFAAIAFANAGDVGHARQFAQMVAARTGLVVDDWPYGKSAALVKPGPLEALTRSLLADYELALRRGEPAEASRAFAHFAEGLAQEQAR